MHDQTRPSSAAGSVPLPPAESTNFAILLMAVVCVSLYVIFKKRDWL
ncbi:hypothetical protein ACFWHQ_13895 [Streptomyces sp. NPDC060334]